MKINNNPTSLGEGILKLIFKKGEFKGSDGRFYERKFHVPAFGITFGLSQCINYNIVENSLVKSYTYYAVWGPELGVRYIVRRHANETFFDAIMKIAEEKGYLPTFVLGIVDSYLIDDTTEVEGSITYFLYRITQEDEIVLKKRFSAVKTIDVFAHYNFTQLFNTKLAAITMSDLSLFFHTEGDYGHEIIMKELIPLSETVNGSVINVGNNVVIKGLLVTEDLFFACEITYCTMTRKGVIYVFDDTKSKIEKIVIRFFPRLV